MTVAPCNGVGLPFLEEGRTFAPRNGAGVLLLLKEGERLRPTFLFLLQEKKKRAAPGTKKKRTRSGFRGESCSFFLRVYVLKAGALALSGLPFPLAPLTLSGRIA